MKRQANSMEAAQRVTVGDTMKFEAGKMTFNESVSFLADMVTIANDPKFPRWIETYNNKEPYATAIRRMKEDGCIDDEGNVLSYRHRIEPHPFEG